MRKFVIFAIISILIIIPIVSALSFNDILDRLSLGFLKREPLIREAPEMCESIGGTCFMGNSCPNAYVEDEEHSFTCSLSEIEPSQQSLESSQQSIESSQGVSEPSKIKGVGKVVAIRPLCCVPRQGYLNVQTLEDSYETGERVNLTDPPLEERSSFSGVLSNIADFFKTLFNLGEIKESPIQQPRELELSLMPEIKTLNQTNLTFYGFIIQFKEDPIGVKQVELEKQLEQSIITESELEIELNNYIINIQNLHNQAIQDLQRILPDNKVIGDYTKVFNGIAISSSYGEIARIRNLPYIEKIYPNYEVKTMLNESVPLINADDVWNLGYTGSGMRIAIIDTGVDYIHGDLNEGKVIQQDCYCSEYPGWRDSCCPNGQDEQHGTGAAMDDHGHGTHVAGIAAGDGDASSGVLKGVAPDANIHAIKVLSSGGSGLSSDIIAGIERATDPNGDNDFSDHVDVISMSLGGPGNPNEPEAQAVDNAVDIGVVVSVSAGNSGPYYGTIGCPGCARKAITVGASDKQDFIPSFSSRGPNSILGVKPDVVAPGVDICSSQWDNAWFYDQCYDDEHTSISGTSMAAPHASGAATLIKQAHPDWTPDKVRAALKQNSLETNTSFLFGIELEDSRGFINFSGTNEICLKLDHDTYELRRACEIDHAKAYIYSWNNTLHNLGNAILRSISGEYPGEIIQENEWAIEEAVTGDLLGLVSYFDNIPKQCYWLCTTINNNALLIVADDDPFYINKYYDTLTGSWEDVGPGIGGLSREMDVIMGLDYNIKSDAFSQGAGRIDVLKAITTPVIASPDSLELGINNPSQNTLLVSLNLSRVGYENYRFTGDVIIDDELITGNVNNPILYIGQNTLSLTFNDITQGVFTGVLLLEAIENPNITLRISLRVYIDYSPPQIENTRPEDWIFDGEAYAKYVVWNSDDTLSSASIYYREIGTSQIRRLDGGPLFWEYDSSSSHYQNFYSVDITELEEGTYEYYVSATNPAGLESIDDNDGNYYTFAKLNSEPISQEGYAEVVNDLPEENKFLITDLNNNNRKELTYRNTWGNWYLTAFENMGDDTYDDGTIVVDDSSFLLDTGDSDNDGLIEILVARGLGGGVRLYEILDFVEGEYMTEEIWSDPSAAVYEHGGKISDLDDDGKMDIAYVKEYEGVKIWENSGDNSYVNVQNISNPDLEESSPLAIGDFDNDGKMEMVTGSMDGVITVIENIRDNTYGIVWSQQIYPFWNAHFGASAVHDFDNNGKDEFIISSSLSDSYWTSRFIMFESDKDNSYRTKWSIAGYGGLGVDADAAEGDADGYGTNEVVITAGETYLLKNIGNNSFEPIWYYPEGASEVGIDDLDQDNEPELVLGNINYPPHLSIFEYEGPLKSLIQNTGTIPIRGYLLMKVQRKVSGNWQDYAIIVDEDTKRNIMPGSYLALDTIWNDVGFSTYQQGNYRAYAALRDENGEIIETLSGPLEDWYEFTVGFT